MVNPFLPNRHVHAINEQLSLPPWSHRIATGSGILYEFEGSFRWDIPAATRLSLHSQVGPEWQDIDIDVLLVRRTMDA